MVVALDPTTPFPTGAPTVDALEGATSEPTDTVKTVSFNQLPPQEREKQKQLHGLPILKNAPPSSHYFPLSDDPTHFSANYGYSIELQAE